MLLFLKDIVFIGISLATGALISLGVLPTPAVAPDLTPPTPVIQKTEKAVTATTSPTREEIKNESVTASEEEGSQEPGTTPNPYVDNFEKSLQEALDALATIEAQKNKPTLGQATLNETTRDAVVNILCTTDGAGPLNPISGSGVVISPNGVVLTNAHVAQYFLLKDYPVPNFVTCIIRTGSPATITYTAELLFLPPSWIKQNAQKIDDERPTGNGEHDYALILLTGKIDGTSITEPLPYLPLVVNEPKQNSPVLLAGYPAGFLGGATIQTDLYKTSAEARVKEVYTYSDSTIDLFSIGGSIVAQSGSSGGAVAQENTLSKNDAALLGVIVTSSSAPDTASRDLRALSTNYIIRDFARERGVSLETILNSNLENELINFHLNVFPTLSAALIQVLNN